MVQLYNAEETLEARYRISMYKRLLLKLGVADKDILDVGCRQGYWTGWFLEQDTASVTAIDINHDDIQVCKENYPQAHCIEADATTYQFKELYNLIFCKDVIEHIETDRQLIKNLASHLKPRGHLIIGTQNYQSLIHLIDGFYSLMIGRVWKGYDPGHVRFYSKAKLEEIYRMAGLEPSQCVSTWHSPYYSLTDKVFGKPLELKIFHLPDLLGWNGVFPFDRTGFNICVVGHLNGEDSKR